MSIKWAYSAQFRFILPFVPVTSILSVRDQCISDTHQSPIGIKAVVLLYQPLVHLWTPENHRFHAVSNCYVTDLMVINQPRESSRHRRIRQNKPKQYRYICGCSSFQSSLVDSHQPPYRFTAAAVFIIETVSPYQTTPDHA